MVILHVAPINTSRANGFRFSVPGLTSSQNRIHGITAGLVNVASSKLLDKDEINSYDFIFIEEFTEFNRLPSPFNKPDIVIFHGVYLLTYIKIYRKLVELNIPYVIVPRVSLTEGAQKQKFLKKKIGNLFLFNKFINNATSIHYLTKNEKELSKRFKTENFVVGNGIKLPQIEKKRVSENTNITFIGRYDINHKGLDVLVKSIINIKEELNAKGVKINFFGSDFRKGKAYIQSQIETFNLHDVLKVNDAVFHNNKHAVLLDTDIFIATSRFEGHPMAVIEAMAYGIPCILTEGTNMLDKLTHYNAGWATELGEKDIEKTILISISSRDEILNKRLNARRLVEENYTWDKVASETLKHYFNIIEEWRLKNHK